ncbi:MAG: efflux RND transporter periplasmic adaptor subunit [Desulfobacteraceae bacterium]|nr:efflux RND transporter periplasmic adaptor subunit [Desulfobacteraceae bacterium]
MKRVLLVFLVLVLFGSAAAGWYFTRRDDGARDAILLYGNVDLRQVNLAFNGNERIATLLVHEGDRVKKGQVLGTLEMERLRYSVERAEARVESQRQVVERLENGTRPEEIEQARANVAAAQTDLNNARRIFERQRRMAGSGATSQQDMENAQTGFEIADAKLRVNHKSLDLAVIGPRKEDIAEAHASLRANIADLALLKQDLEYATLVCPTDGVVQNRILEPGEMASPQRPVLNISITDPKWVRAYVTEPDLAKIRLGMNAVVTSDGFPGKGYEGWVGFISSIAEFTPKTVETTELRTALVYEVRIFVKDPEDELRLGMPATVKVPLARAGEKEKGQSLSHEG